MTKRKRTTTKLQMEKGGESIVTFFFLKINNKSFFKIFFLLIFLTKTETSFTFKLPWTFEIKTIIDLLLYVGACWLNHWFFFLVKSTKIFISIYGDLILYALHIWLVKCSPYIYIYIWHQFFRTTPFVACFTKIFVTT